MRYLDTSVLVAYLANEANSLVAETFLLSQGAPFAISTWVEVEFLSALSHKIRTRQLTKLVADGIVRKYRQSILPHFRLIPIADSDHVRAARLRGIDGKKQAGSI